MSGSTKSIYRVRQLVGTDGVIVTEVSEEGDSLTGYAHPKEVRNGKIRLGGIDSFWLVTNVKPERKFSSTKQEAPPAFFPSASATSSLIGRIKDSSDFDVSSPFGGLAKQDKIEGVSFGSAIRLLVAIGPSGTHHDELIRDLRDGQLAVEFRNTVDAIEVRPNVFMISGFVRHPSGLYGLSPETRIGAVPTVTIVGKTETIRLSSGLVVFCSRPRWTTVVETDLRSDDEILASAESWLARLQIAASLSDGDTPKTPAELLKAFAAASVAAEEREDLESALRVLSERQALPDVLSQLIANDEGWRVRLQEFEHAEQERLRAEIRARLADEVEHEASRLAELREQILDAEGRLATIAHQEVLLRNETEQHDARLEKRIAEAARAVSGASLSATEKLREELAQLRAELEHADRVVAAEVVTSAVPEEIAPAPPPARTITLVLAAEGDRLRVLKELASSSGLALSDLIAVILHSTEDVPVLVGDGSAGIAADIATSLGGETAAIVFCDPTRVSFADLLQDKVAGLGRAIEIAKDNPDVLVPVALCGLTNGPCEYWLPQLVEMRRIGRLPSNLALFASAGTDGMRVSVPKSVLRYLFPLPVSRTEPIANVDYVGSWKPFVTDATRIQDAIKTLRAKSVEPALMGRFADMLARVPAVGDADQNEIAGALLGEQKWIAAWRDGGEHDLIQHFQRLGS